MSDLPPDSVLAAAIRVADARRYVRKHFPNAEPGLYVGHQPADEFHRDLDAVVAWVLDRGDGSMPRGFPRSPSDDDDDLFDIETGQRFGPSEQDGRSIDGSTT